VTVAMSYIADHKGYWWVRVPGYPGRCFSHRKLGWERALKDAVAHRNACVRKAGFKTVTAMVRARSPINASKSGIVGVYHTLIRGRPSWVAKIDLGRTKRLKRSFSIAKYGEREAKRRAIEMRAAMVAHYRQGETP